uniref:Uncharacterized protein n=1 Tax=Avena sativa TaxID=4498 RepID=A0ACD5WTN4_AVESA
MMTLVSTLPAQWPVGTSTSGCPSSAKVVLFYASLYLVAVAQGPDSPCALAFAADQFDPNHPKEHAARSSLFNWWYFCFTIGVALAIGAVSYVQENLGWGIGFGMLCAIILCAFTVFLVGTPTYRLHAPTPGAANPFTLLARSLVTVVKKKADIIQYQLGIIGDEEEDSMAAKQEDAHRVLRMLSIWVSCLPYGVVFAQVMTLFNKQGRTLDRRIVGTLELPPAALQVFGPATILLFVPCYECALVPLLRCATGNPTGLTLLQRLGTGMALSLAAVSTAALVEARRLEIAREHGLADIADAVVPMSWGWLVPQYVMIGLGCVFGEVGMQEFFYDQMPGELRSLGLALYSSVIGIGSFISGILIALIDVVTRNGGGDSWFADNLNRAHLDYFYWVLAGLSAVELALFLWLASSYTYKKHIIKSLICSE